MFLGDFDLVHFVEAVDMNKSDNTSISMWLKDTHQVLFTQLPEL